MADNSVLTEAGETELQVRRMIGQMRCALPGTIVSFDSSSQRCVAQPGIQLKVVRGSEVLYMDLPPVKGVPVVFPYAQGAGVLLTHPINAGDPCLLIFADRDISNFVEQGSSQIPGSSVDEDVTSPRTHHLSDAICIPGFISDPVVVPSWNNENIELRDFERKNYISLGPSGITITDGSATWNMSNGKVTLSAPTGIQYTTPNQMTVASSNMDLGANNRITGNLRSDNGTFIDKNSVNLNTHRHGGGPQPDK